MSNIKQFKREGFLILREAISLSYIEQLDRVAQDLMRHQTADEKSRFKSLGSLVSLWSDNQFSELIAHPKILSAIKQLGGHDIRYDNGYLLCKEQQSIPTFWHQDWWDWSDPRSYTQFIHQVGVLCYLEDVDESNGCLRILPGSHRVRHSLHDFLTNSDKAALRRGDDLSSPVYQNQPDQLAIKLYQGDVVLIDARLLHGAYANQSSQPRNGIVMWYYPNYDMLLESQRCLAGAAPDDAYELSHNLKIRKYSAT